ncbi:hypothetical protein DFH09DRAFT_905465, partial [Mycena vulgaris]
INPTETLPAREVFHEIQTAIRPLMAHVQTREQVDDLLHSLDAIRYRRSRETIHDPPAIQHKGRPRTERLTGALEGRPVGGGARAGKRRLDENPEKENDNDPPRKKVRRQCALCHQEGHNRTTCALARR